MTLRFAGLYHVGRNNKDIIEFRKIFSTKLTKEHHHRNSKAEGRTISTRTERRVLGVITHLASLEGAPVKLKTLQD